jgi:2-hydroxychromene-2-carboxylate isomerase
MGETSTVRFYLDFVSPYTWLALMEARRFAAANGVRWDLRPVVYAALLDARGLVGPAEVDAKRDYTFRDVARCARRLGLALTGPPAHPFRSLEALRTFLLFRDAPAALDLAEALADAAWGKGRDLADLRVLAEAVTEAGLEAGDLGRRIAEPAVKAALRASTEEAIAAGVFGVPTFSVGGALFWGHDRMPHLADHLAGRLPAHLKEAEAMLARPRGADRRAGPRRHDGGQGRE